MTSDEQISRLLENSEKFAASLAQLPIQFENINSRFERMEKATELLIRDQQTTAIVVNRTEVEIKQGREDIKSNNGTCSGLAAEIDALKESMNTFKIRILWAVCGSMGALIITFITLMATHVIIFK